MKRSGGISRAPSFWTPGRGGFRVVFLLLLLLFWGGEGISVRGNPPILIRSFLHSAFPSTRTSAPTTKQARRPGGSQKNKVSQAVILVLARISPRRPPRRSLRPQPAKASRSNPHDGGDAWGSPTLSVLTVPPPPDALAAFPLPPKKGAGGFFASGWGVEVGKRRAAPTHLPHSPSSHPPGRPNSCYARPPQPGPASSPRSVKAKKLLTEYLGASGANLAPPQRSCLFFSPSVPSGGLEPI